MIRDYEFTPGSDGKTLQPGQETRPMQPQLSPYEHLDAAQVADRGRLFVQTSSMEVFVEDARLAAHRRTMDYYAILLRAVPQK